MTVLAPLAPPASPAGPITEEELAGLAPAPELPISRPRQILQFHQRQIQYVFRGRRLAGPTFRMRTSMPGGLVVTSHPEHVRSLFTADPALAPSMAGESPARPVLGPSSVLTSVGERHMRQRKLLLPPFHGEAIARYTEMITGLTEAEIDRWPVGLTFPLAPRMRAITLDVIMGGVFGIEGMPSRHSPEWRLRFATKRLIAASAWRVSQVAELMNITQEEPVGLLKAGLGILDRLVYTVIAERRRAADLERRHDILSLLLQARTEEGEALTDKELRDELLTLVLAGHETTANTMSWTWERLLRSPEAHERLLAAVRGGDGAEEIEATILESMRARPVLPMLGRRVKVPWQLGEYGVPAGTPVTISALLLHHREDLYPRPFDFLPERWYGRKPGTYEWVAFGGGIRRCLGATLAMSQQRVVLEAMARRLDLTVAEPAPERALHRNVTMIPARGGRVVLRARRR